MAERSAPIGVMDSGVGGLSVLAEIQRLLPNEAVLSGHVGPVGLTAGVHAWQTLQDPAALARYRRAEQPAPEPVADADPEIAMRQRVQSVSQRHDRPGQIIGQSRRCNEAADSVELVDDGDYPTPVGDAVAQDVVYVGRVRGGIDEAEQLNLWLTTDNVRKGAALNAVQLAELLIKDLA